MQCNNYKAKLFTVNFAFVLSAKLIKEVTKQAKVTDVSGSSEYICQAVEAKKVIILNRITFALLRTI